MLSSVNVPCCATWVPDWVVKTGLRIALADLKNNTI
jgi:hypothetical protein